MRPSSPAPDDGRSPHARLRGRLLRAVSASSLALAACGGRTNPPLDETHYVTVGGGGAAGATTAGGAGGISGTGGASGKGGAGAGGTAGASGSAGAAGCEPLPPEDVSGNGLYKCDNAGAGFTLCQLRCYQSGLEGAPPGACLASDDPKLMTLPGFMPQVCGLKLIEGGPYCPPDKGPGSCCYLALSQPCTGRPLLLGNTLRLASLVVGAGWA